jgi:hypothetical protein
MKAGRRLGSRIQRHFGASYATTCPLAGRARALGPVRFSWSSAKMGRALAEHGSATAPQAYALIQRVSSAAAHRDAGPVTEPGTTRHQEVE